MPPRINPRNPQNQEGFPFVLAVAAPILAASVYNIISSAVHIATLNVTPDQFSIMLESGEISMEVGSVVMMWVSLIAIGWDRISRANRQNARLLQPVERRQTRAQEVDGRRQAQRQVQMQAQLEAQAQLTQQVQKENPNIEQKTSAEIAVLLTKTLKTKDVQYFRTLLPLIDPQIVEEAIKSNPNIFDRAILSGDPKLFVELFGFCKNGPLENLSEISKKFLAKEVIGFFKEEQESQTYICPISFAVIQDPVCVNSGNVAHYYERDNISRIQRHPVTGVLLLPEHIKEVSEDYRSGLSRFAEIAKNAAQIAIQSVQDGADLKDFISRVRDATFIEDGERIAAKVNEFVASRKGVSKAEAAPLDVGAKALLNEERS